MIVCDEKKMGIILCASNRRITDQGRYQSYRIYVWPVYVFLFNLLIEKHNKGDM